jgi:hypothetical protein
MLMLHMRRATLDAIPDNFQRIVSGLGPAFKPVLGPALDLQAEHLGLLRARLTSSSDGQRPGTQVHYSDLFGVESGVIGIQISEVIQRAYFAQTAESEIRRGDKQIILFAAGSPKVVEQLDDLASILNEQLNVKLEPFRYVSNSFRELIDEGMKPPAAPSEDETAGANLLADPSVRRAALAIASSGGLLVKDLPKQLPTDQQDRSSAITEDLEAIGLVSSDLVVVCRKTAEQVLRVPSERALEKAAEAGVHCACGANVRDETTELALSLTELGRRLLDGSWWMTVLLMQELERLGVERRYMLVEQNDGGDEVDCFADISGAMAIFELKDKEFSLGNAYSFGSKFGIYRPAHSVVVTTSHVGNDAKEHFKKALSAERAERHGAGAESTTSIEYIEGLENLRGGLEELIGGIYASDAEMLLRPLLPGAALDSASIVEAIGDQYENQQFPGEAVAPEGAEEAVPETDESQPQPADESSS